MRTLCLALLLALGCSDPDPSTLPDGATNPIDPRCAAMAGAHTIRARYLDGRCLEDCEGEWVTCPNAAGALCAADLTSVTNCGRCDFRCSASNRCVSVLLPDGGNDPRLGGIRYDCRP